MVIRLLDIHTGERGLRVSLRDRQLVGARLPDPSGSGQ